MREAERVDAKSAAQPSREQWCGRSRVGFISPRLCSGGVTLRPRVHRRQASSESSLRSLLGSRPSAPVHSRMMTTRWIAYDAPPSPDAAAASASSAAAPSDSDNVEIEPGNHKHAAVSWSETELRPCEWRGIDGAARKDGAFASSILPHRSITFEWSGATPMRSQHSVAFVPASFLCFPAALGESARAECEAHRESKLQSLLASFEAASERVSSSAYIRFRSLWMICRDGAPLSVQAAVLRRLNRHPNLSAPVETHDPKALHRKMSSFVLPRATAAEGMDAHASSASTTPAASAASAQFSPSPPPSSAAPSAYHALLASCGPGLLPATPLRCSLSDPSAMALEVLRALVHAQTCCTLDWPVDAAKWTVEADQPTKDWVARWRAGFDASCQSVEAWLLAHIAARMQCAQWVLHRFQELMHPRLVVHLLSQALPLDWTDATFQAAIVRLLLHSDAIGNPARDYPCSIDHAFSFWSALQKELEWSQTPEIDDAFPTEIGRLLEQRKRAASRPQQTIDAHYWTATYRHEIIAATEDEDGEEEEHSATASASPSVPFDFRSVTLRMSSGFGSTTGLTLWPAGFLLCEWILQHPQLFRGRRVLELGCGIGLTWSVALQRNSLPRSSSGSLALTRWSLLRAS